MTGRFILQAALAALVAFIVAGCGTSPAPAGPTGSPTPLPTATPTTQPSPSATATAGSGVGVSLTVHFFNVGQGDATLLQGPDFTVLIDAARHDRTDLVPHLQSTGITSIDLLVGTHPHADHIGQVPQVMAEFAVGEVWFSGETNTTRTFERAIDAVTESDAGYHEPRAGEVFEFGAARVEVVNPDQLTGDVHEGSVSLRIVYGEVAFMFTGDAEAKTERAMVARGHDLKAQILQVGHHGSRTSSSSEFLAAVQPEVAIYSAATGNSFGHPHPEALANLAAAGAEIYGTDVNGTVVVVTDGRTYEVLTERGAALVGPPAASTPTTVAVGCVDGQIDVNTAPDQTLTQIIHIGPARAEALVGMRPFASVDDLDRISGIGPAHVADIKAQGLACVSGGG